MDYLKTGLLIIVPFIIYELFIHWFKNKYDIELNKMANMMIFTIIDILIFMFVNYLGL